MYRREMFNNVFILFTLERHCVITNCLIRDMGNGKVVLGSIIGCIRVVDSQLGLILDTTISVEEGY